MAEYIRFRWTRAKAGVTMAFLALLGGLADRAANAEGAQGHAAAAPFFPKLTFNGVPSAIRTQFVKLDKDLQASFAKYDKVIATLDKHVVELKTNVYDKLEANATFLSKTDAGKIYMKEGSAATNSAELGGLGADAFVQGTGAVATGAATATITDGTMPLVSTADRSISVQTEFTGNGASVVITNSSANAMTWVATINGTMPTQGTLGGNGGQATLALAIPASLLGQATVQLLPAVPTGPVATLTVSTEPATGGGQTFVAQMLNGDG